MTESVLGSSGLRRRLDLVNLSCHEVRASWRLRYRLRTTLPLLCSPANPSRSPFCSAKAPPGAPAASWPLVAGSLFLLQALMNGSTESLPSMLMGTTLAGLVAEPAFRPQAGEAVTESGCVKKIPGFKFRRTSSTRNSFHLCLFLIALRCFITPWCYLSLPTYLWIIACGLATP